MNGRTTRLLGVTFATVVALSACSFSGNNPLLSANKADTVNFLVLAEQYASNKTYLYYGGNSVYVNCILNRTRFDNPDTGKNKCHAFLTAMISYAAQSRLFKKVTLDDLKNKTVARAFSAGIRARQDTR